MVVADEDDDHVWDGERYDHNGEQQYVANLALMATYVTSKQTEPAENL